MKTLAERLDEEESALDEQERLRRLIDDALKRGQKNAEALYESTRGMFGQHPDDYRLVLR